MKAWKIGLIASGIFLVGGIVSSLSIRAKTERSNQHLKEANQNLSSTVETLNEKITTLQKQVNQSGTGEIVHQPCQFVRTYRFINFVTYDAVSDAKFALVEEFQGSRPMIAKLTPEQAQNMKKGNYYEFTLQGTTEFGNRNDLDFYTINTVTSTNKIGLEQTQESCIIGS